MSHTFILLLALITSQAYAIDLKDYLSLPANPMKIDVTLDNEYVSKKIMAKTGGNLLLTTSNGDTFELTLPPNSLQQDTEITLQKIKRVKHPKLSPTANYLSVEISPDGIQLQVPAKLVFKSKRTYPIKNLTPFSAQADGDETHLAILSGNQTPNEIRIGLLHFSNYTISDDASAAEIIDNGLSRMETTRITNWLTRQILESKRSGGDIAVDMDKAFRDSFNNVILPSFFAVNSCATGRYALENYLGWKRQIELVGGNAEQYFPPNFGVDLSSVLTDTAEQCLAPAIKACYEDHRPIEVMDYALHFMKIGELLGAPKIVDKFHNLAMKCSKFKFFMESEIWAGETRADSTGVTAKAEFDFSINPYSRELIEGSIDVESSYILLSSLDCERTFFHTKPSNIMITNFLTHNNADEKNFTLSIGGLTPYSQAKFRCVDKEDPEYVIEMGVPMMPEGSYWGGMFIGTHGPTGLNEYDMNTGFFHLKGWQVRHDTRYAVKEYTQTVEGLLNESTSIIIYHTPAPL